MEQLGIALVALAAGVVVGAAAMLRRRATPTATNGGSFALVEARLEAQSAELRRLADSAVGRELAGEQLRSGLDGARRVLEALQVRDAERQSVDADQREVIKRLSTVLAGGATKGRAGENVLRQHLSELPPGMLVTDFRVGGKVVEFGLLLPDGRRLPIDSKWTALAELEALELAESPGDIDGCTRAVEKAVTIRAREVAQYLDPAVTAPVAIAAVPDAVYGVLRRAHADAYAKGVVVVPYSHALPIVLFLYSLVQRFGDAADVQASLAEVAGALTTIESVLENKLARAAVMLSNGTDELRSSVGKARGSIARAGTEALTRGGGDEPGVLSVVN
jgi:hypothetical protein